MSIMKTIFNFGNNRNSRKTHSSVMRFRPQMEPLEDRHLLAVASLATVEGTLSPTDSFTSLNLQVESEKAAFLGIQITSGSFDPAVVKVIDTNTNTAVTGKVIYDTSSSSLLLVQLKSGDYTIEVRGDHTTYGDFQCDVFMPGDINGAGVVSSSDYAIANAAFQLSMGTLNAFTIAALEKQGITLSVIQEHVGKFDIDGDGKVSVFEMEAIGVNSTVGTVDVSIVTMADRPVIDAKLLESASATGNITSNPTITGTVSNPGLITAFQASFDGASWTNITLNSAGAFTITADMMKDMSGSPVANNGDITSGSYVLQFKAIDRFGEQTVDLNCVVIAESNQPLAGNKTDYAT